MIQAVVSHANEVFNSINAIYVHILLQNPCFEIYDFYKMFILFCSILCKSCVFLYYSIARVQRIITKAGDGRSFYRMVGPSGGTKNYKGLKTFLRQTIR